MKASIQTEDKQKEAIEQLEKYKKTEEIKMIPQLRSYSVVAIKDELYIEEDKKENNRIINRAFQLLYIVLNCSCLAMERMLNKENILKI